MKRIWEKNTDGVVDFLRARGFWPLAVGVFGSWSQFSIIGRKRSGYGCFLFHPFTWSFQSMTTIHSSVVKEMRNANVQQWKQCPSTDSRYNIFSFPMHCCSLILSYLLFAFLLFIAVKTNNPHHCNDVSVRRHHNQVRTKKLSCSFKCLRSC